ncbi:hypothetical protein LXL04_016296 [Taraxacum kok-saghyz]
MKKELRNEQERRGDWFGIYRKCYRPLEGREKEEEQRDKRRKTPRSQPFARRCEITPFRPVAVFACGGRRPQCPPLFEHLCLRAGRGFGLQSRKERLFFRRQKRFAEDPFYLVFSPVPSPIGPPSSPPSSLLPPTLAAPDFAASFIRYSAPPSSFLRFHRRKWGIESCITNAQSADVKKQTVFFLQTADIWSTSSSAEVNGGIEVRSEQGDDYNPTTWSRGPSLNLSPPKRPPPNQPLPSLPLQNQDNLLESNLCNSVVEKGESR